VALRLERRGPIAILTIDRPEARNALTLAMHSELVRLWEIVQRDPVVRVVVVTGAADPASPPERQSFCAGADVKELAGDVYADPARVVPSLAAVEREKPVIAAVNGYCIGAGLTMVLAADLRVAAATATFALPEVGLGTVPGNGGVRRAALELPHAALMELLLLPGRMGAGRALELGLVNAVVPSDEVLPTALRWAEEISALPPAALQAAMTLVARAPRLPAAEAASLERDLLSSLRQAGG
jgi:enoyl-CoA hydratase/carnithine racemase